MDSHNCDVSIFSDVRNYFKWCSDSLAYYLVIFSPFISLPILIPILSGYLKQKVCPIAFSDEFCFNFAILTANTINVVLIGSVAYLYKESIFKLEDIEKVVDSVGNIIKKIDDGKEDLKQVFRENSISDLKNVFSSANKITKRFHNNLYFVELVLIFLSVVWAVLDFPLTVMENGSAWWHKYTFIIGFTLFCLLIIYMICHGIVIILQFFIRRKVAECLDDVNIKKKWHKFQNDLQEAFNSKKITEDIANTKNILGLD